MARGKKKTGKRKFLSKRTAIRTEISDDNDLRFRIRELERAVNDGRGRRALALARKLEKDFSEDHSDTKVMIVKAHELRLCEMIDDLHISEAIAIYQEVIKRNPDWENLFTAEFQILLEFHGMELIFLLCYPDENTSRETVIKCIRDRLKDPRLITENPQLPDDHPLKIEAAIIIDVWNAIENNVDLPSNSLTSISRKSPFNYWRLFLQGLAAFYQGNDQQCMRNISRIPSGGAVKPAADILATLIGAKDSQSRQTRNICRKLEPSNLGQRLKNVDLELDHPNGDAVKNEVLDICRTLNASKQKSMSFDLLTSFMIKWDNGLYDLWDDLEFLKICQDTYLLCLRLDRYFDLEEIGDWEDYISNPSLNISSIDRSLIYAHLARLAAKNPGVGYDNFMWATRKKKRIDKKKCSSLFQQSVDSCPLQETFRDWYDIFNKHKWNSSNIVKQWHHHFPEDEDPIFYLLDESRRTNAVNKVETYFSRLQELLGNSPRLQEIAPFIALERAIFTLKRSKKCVPNEVIEKIPDEPVVVGVAKCCLRWHHISNGRKDRKIIEESLENLRQPLLILYCLHEIFPNEYRFQSLPNQVKKQFKNPDCLVTSLITVFQITDLQWKVKTLPWPPELKKSFSSKSLSSSLISGLLDVIYQFDPSLGQGKNQLLDSVILITKNGLKRDDIPKADMFIYRALVYAAIVDSDFEMVFNINEKIEELLFAASYCIEQGTGNGQLLHSAMNYLQVTGRNKSEFTWTSKKIKALATVEAAIGTRKKMMENISRTSCQRNLEALPSIQDFEFEMKKILDMLPEFDDEDETKRYKKVSGSKDSSKNCPQNPSKHKLSSSNDQPELPGLF